MWRYWIFWPVSKLLLQWFRFGMWLFNRSEHEDPLADDWLVMIVAYPFGVVDIIYNYTIGAFILWEWNCCDLVFTERLNRLARTEPIDTTRYALVVRMGEQLNRYDPDHVRFPQ